MGQWREVPDPPVAPFRPVGERTPRTGHAALVLGALSVLLGAVALLALINSFELDPAPGEGPAPPAQEPGTEDPGRSGAGGGDGGGGGGSGSGDGRARMARLDCGQTEATFNWAGAAAFALAVLSVAPALLAHRRRLRAFYGSPWLVPAGVLTGLGALLVLAALAVRLMCRTGFHAMDPEHETGGPGGGGGGDGGTGEDAYVPPITIDWVVLLLVLVAVLAVVALLVLAFLLRRQAMAAHAARAEPADVEVESKEARDLVRLLRAHDLESRDAVIATYRSFLAWCAARQVPKLVTETPHEHAARLQARLRLPKDVLRDLLGLYDIARLSPRSPTPEEREAAATLRRRLVDSIARRVPEAAA